MSDENIIVKWEASDRGARFGVLMCVVVYFDNDGVLVITDAKGMQREIGGDRRPDSSEAIIWDRTRNERAIVPLSTVSLVEPLCEICGGEGAYWDTSMASPGIMVSCECQAKATQ